MSPSERDLTTTAKGRQAEPVRPTESAEVLAEIGRAAAALALELGLSGEQSELAGQEVEFAITRSGLRVLTPGLVRELTLAVLADRGVADAALRARSRIGMVVADAERLIRGEAAAPPAEQKGGGRDPLDSDRAMAAAVKREYALQTIFSEEVAAAHLAGDLHIEKLGEPDRLFSLVQLPSPIGEEGARSPASALVRLNSETRSLAAHLSGELVWDAFNWSLAPGGESGQEYAELVRETLTTALGGTSCRRVALHLDWDPPAHLAALPAGAELTGRVQAARDLMKALLSAGEDGGGPSVQFIVHVTPQWAAGHDYHPALDALVRAAAAGRTVRVALDREGQDPWLSRYGLTPRRTNFLPRAFCFGRVSINLVRLARAAGKDPEAYFKGLVGCVELVAQAHLEKRVFLEKMLALGARGPLPRLALRDGQSNRPFLRLDRAIHLVCPIGLGEAARVLAGESLTAAELGSLTLKRLAAEAERLSALHKIRLLVAPTRSLGAPARLARLDHRLEHAARPPARLRSYDPSFSVCPEDGRGRDLFSKVEADGRFHLETLFEPAVNLGVKDADPGQLKVLISRALYQSEAVSLLFN